MRSNQKGFTLIELLVVIAIIGILSSVVLASLNTAREKARDVRRIADINSIQLALELYFDENDSYPIYDGTATSTKNGLDALETAYMSSVPADPLGTLYLYASDGGTEYHLAADLENASNDQEGNADCNSTSSNTCLSEEQDGGFDGTAAASGRAVRYDRKN